MQPCALPHAAHGGHPDGRLRRRRRLRAAPRLLAVGTTLKNTGVIQVYTMGRELSRAAEINMDFGLNCVTFRGSSLVDRRLAVGDFGGRVYSYDVEEGKEVCCCYQLQQALKKVY